MAKKVVKERGLFGQVVVDARGSEIVRAARSALRIARRHMRDYAHVNAPKKYTQPQLFACLIVKALLGVTYRRCEELLMLMPAVREAIGLRDVPRFTTLQTFAERPEVMALTHATLRDLARVEMKHVKQSAAFDGTGVETTSASAHFISRAGRKRTKFVKIMLGVLCTAVMPGAMEVGWGPTHDMREAWRVREKLLEACGENKPTMLFGDGAFDCEAWHKANWETTNTPSYAPVTIKSVDGSVGGFYRNVFSEMKPHEYGERWSCESANSAIKRVTGATLRSRKENTLFTEAALKVAAYTIKV